jgi:hypothetical protein
MSNENTHARTVEASWDVPLTPSPANFVIRDTCFSCGDYGWCLLVLSTPTVEQGVGHMPTCGRCLIDIGAILRARPLEVGRLEGYEMMDVTVERGPKEQ